MADELSVLLKVRGDASGAKSELKSVEASIQSVKERIKEVKAEAKGEIPFKTERLEALREKLKDLTTQHRQLTKATADAAKAHREDLAGALQTISPRLAGFSSILTGTVGSLTLASTALVAVAGAAVAAGAAIFDLTKKTAEATGKFKDLAQQTGFSVETLSALSNVAETTGGNISTVTGALGIFEKNMVEAQDSTTEFARLFKQLGIDTNDNEKALRQAIAALRQLPEGAQQTALALRLFGRSGREVLAISKELPGTLDEAIESMRGVNLVTTEAANKGDDLSDAIVRLSQVFGHATHVLGEEFGPDVKRIVEDLTKLIIDNKDAIREWSTSFADATRGLLIVTDAVRKLGGAITGLGNLPIPTVLKILGSVSGATGILQGLESLGSQQRQSLGNEPFVAESARPAFRRPNFSPFRPDQLGAPPKSKSAGQDPGVQILQQLQKELRGLEDATRAEEVAAELLDTRFKNLNPKIREQILLVARTIDTKREQIKVDKETQEIAERQEREHKAAMERLSGFLREQVEQLQELRGNTKSAFDEVDDFIIEMGRLGEKLDDNQVFWLRFNASMVEAAKHANQLKGVFDNLVLPELVGGEGGGGPLDILPGEEPPDSPIRNLNDAINELGVTMANVFGAGQEAGQEFANILKGAIGELAFGVGALVENWVLVGETGPAAMRKLTASVLAGVAAQAAVKAIFELAEGFAALFFNPAAAAAHFKAAALFGAVAGVAAVAGRSVAGDLFRPTGGGAGTTGAGGGSSGQLNPLTLNRNQPQRIIVEFRANGDKISQAFTAVVLDDLDTAGPIRQAFADDGRFQP